MATDLARRAWLKQALLAFSATATVPSLLARSQTLSDAKRLLVPGNYRGQSWLAWLDAETLNIRSRTLLPQRAHGVLAYPPQPELVLVFSRRPGREFWLVDPLDARILRRIEAAEERHFFGHGLWWQNLLVVSENDTLNGRGLLSLRDAQSLQTLTEMDSGGIGPHELLALDNQRIAVANGGILTLPETGRVKLNRASMDPNLSYIDLSRMQLLSQHRPLDHRLSVRHLAKTSDGKVAVAMQDEASSGYHHALLAVHDGELLLPAAPLPQGWAAMGGYAASVSCQGNFIAVSFPKAGRVGFWMAEPLEYLGDCPLPAGAGLAATEQGFWLSSEQGELQLWLPSLAAVLRRGRHPGWRWDNHAYWL